MVRDFISKVGIFRFLHKKMSISLGANTLNLFEFFM